MASTTIIAIVLFIIGALSLTAYMLTAGGYEREGFKYLAGICISLAALCLLWQYAEPHLKKAVDEYNRQSTTDSYDIQAYYEVESMRRIEKEEWFLFIPLGEKEYIEAVIIKDGKKETARFTTDTSADRIRIDQREDNAVGVDVKDKYHLYITQEDYDRILGYQ